jgi:hypothetical protein
MAGDGALINTIMYSVVIFQRAAEFEQFATCIAREPILIMIARTSALFHIVSRILHLDINVWQNTQYIDNIRCCISS